MVKFYGKKSSAYSSVGIRYSLSVYNNIESDTLLISFHTHVILRNGSFSV